MCEFCVIRDHDDDGQTERPAAKRRDGSDPPARSRNYRGPFRKTPGRLFGMAMIRLYQLTLSSLIGNSCRHLPTCSEYGYEAIARHGFWAGGWMTLFRVGRCGPGGTSGFDPVPEVIETKTWFKPWVYWSLGKRSRD
ncbi:membrane protein insertion efficiency factor YidD [Rhizobium sp. LjRoot30]|uniref:membrane protein insertion efficiency factor YidD n=1 Tax=Rhizobium sp. LjRoot30 TaxID=3342320 RepID=UPI003ECCD5B3